MSRRKLKIGSLKLPRRRAARAQLRSRIKTKPRQGVARSRVKVAGSSSTGGDGINRIRTSAKDRILAVATKEFSARGYDGARVDAIMRQSKISKNLIYHYFDSKEQLFIAVLESAYEKIRGVQAEWTTSFSSPTEAVRMLVRTIFNHWRRSPEFMRLLNSENFHNGRHLRKAKGIKAGYAALIANLGQVIKEGEQSGEFRPNIDPVELFISISSLSYHYFSNRYTLLYLLDHDENEEHTRSFLAHTEDVVLSYVQFNANKGSSSRLRARHSSGSVNRR
jgi:TetR/AcrR family transcriptional regulator